jgi:phosphate-selective porin OprO/OprP
MRLFSRAVLASTLLAGTAAAQPTPLVAGTTTEPPAEQPTEATATTTATEPVVVPTSPTTVVASPGLDAAQVNALIDDRLAARKDTAGFKDGFFVQTSDAKTKLKIGGFTQFDGRFFVAEGDDPHTDTFGFRSIRPDLQGTLFEHFDFRLLPDFAGAKIVLQDVYADIHYTDVVKVRFGKFKVPFGLERLQGETNTLFVERGLPTQLAPNRDLGVQVFGEVGKGTLAYQIGVFNGVADGQSGDGDVSDDKEAAARVFVKPFAQSGDARIAELGFGAAVTYGDKVGTLASTDVASFKTQGQTTFFAYKAGTTLMDTVVADGKHWRATGQASYYTGPIGLLAEYVRSAQHVVLDGTHQRAVFDAWQAAAQWVITGDKASYKSVTPDKPLDPAKGQWGAFDVGARIGELRAVDGDVFDKGYADATKSARRAWSAGGGVNWYPNRNFRFVVDYERTWYTLGGKTGDRATENSIVGRVQTVF